MTLYHIKFSNYIISFHVHISSHHKEQSEAIYIYMKYYDLIIMSYPCSGFKFYLQDLFIFYFVYLYTFYYFLNYINYKLYILILSAMDHHGNKLYLQGYINFLVPFNVLLILILICICICISIICIIYGTWIKSFIHSMPKMSNHTYVKLLFLITQN